MDLHERRELDMSAQVARVRAKARPWRAIIALVLALCALAAGEYGRYGRHLDSPTRTALSYGGGIAFLLLGLIAAFGLSGQARGLLQPVIGAAHAGVTRYALVLLSVFAVLVVTLNIVNVPVGQLVLGGAVTGVLIGIAAQQSLANLFAGMVLLFARPFRVGDRVRFRAGALSGIIEGTVTDISITYVRLETDDGPVFVPNSQALAATVGPIPHPDSGQAAGAAAASPAAAAPGSAGPGATAPGAAVAGADASLAAVAGAAAASAVAAILADPAGPGSAAAALAAEAAGTGGHGDGANGGATAGGSQGAGGPNGSQAPGGGQAPDGRTAPDGVTASGSGTVPDGVQGRPPAQGGQ